MEWVEATGTTVDIAVEAALSELNLESVGQAQVEVIQEPKSGFLGVGGRPAIVKVSRKPRQRNRRGRRGAKSEGGGGQQQKPRESRQGNRNTKQDQSSGKAKRPSSPAKKQNNGSPKEQRAMDKSETAPPTQDKPESSIEDQATVAEEFLAGLLAAFGLEGDVQTRIDEDVLYLDVIGEQTEALVGPKGATMYSVLELTRTTVQRRTFGAPRMRIDIAGYGARRREALTIYTGKLAEQVIASGGEMMLEPMNAADRKVVHDAAAAIEGVRTYSEGEEPRRAVVIAAIGSNDAD